MLELCDRCHNECVYGSEEIEGELFCVSCAEIIKKAAAKQQREDEEYELEDLLYDRANGVKQSLAQLRRTNDLLLLRTINTCDSIIASQNLFIRNMKILAAMA